MLPLLVPGILFLLAPQSSTQSSPKAWEGRAGLNFLEGEWTSHETTKGKDGKDVPFDLKGKNTWILEGAFLQMDESFEVPGDVPGSGKFSNHILLSFDGGAKIYRGWWFASSTPKPIVFTGVRTEKAFVLTDDGGRLRIAYDLLEDGHFKAIVEAKSADAWSKITEAEYRRKK